MTQVVYLFVGVDRHIDDTYEIYQTEEAALARVTDWQMQCGDDPKPETWERYGFKELVYGAQLDDGYRVEVHKLEIVP